jgi:YihY family inner membrane protein
MSTATRVPETRTMRGEELSADDAWTTLRRYGRWRLAQEAFLRFRYGDGFTNARALALQLCLAIIPLAIALVGLAGTLSRTKAAQVLLLTLLRLVPGRDGDSLEESLRAGVQQGGTGGTVAVVFGLAAGLVALTVAMGQFERGTNRIYGIERDRPTSRKYAAAAANAGTAGLLLLLGFVLLVAGGTAVDTAARVYGWSDGTQTVWEVLRWPLGVLLVLASITALLRRAPRRCQPGWSWLALGALVALVLWIVFTALLTLYVERSGSFGSTYGPITGVFALLLWANLTSVALLLGSASAAQLEAVRTAHPRPATPDPETEPETEPAAAARTAATAASGAHRP